MSMVRLERDGAVAQIVLARREAGNAVSLALCRAFAEAVETCAGDPSVRAVLVRAEGPTFASAAICRRCQHRLPASR